MTTPTITLSCVRCGNFMDYDREVDPSIPLEVVLIKTTHCDRCDDGDFGTEMWFDIHDNEVSQDV